MKIRFFKLALAAVLLSGMISCVQEEPTRVPAKMDLENADELGASPLTFSNRAETKTVNFTADGDWYVYGEAVDPGKSTAPLDVTITFPTRKKADNDPSGYEIGDNFNVVVVYESTPAKYDKNNDPAPDWSLVYDTVSEERGK